MVMLEYTIVNVPVLSVGYAQPHLRAILLLASKVTIVQLDGETIPRQEVKLLENLSPYSS